MNILEGMYGTSRSSYLRLENARLIVRHSAKIDETMIGARGRCVEQIFIENAQGERFLCPTTKLAPARAMAQHVNQGGRLDDDVGGHIGRMARTYSDLAECARFVRANAGTLSEGALDVRERCRNEMRTMRKTFERLCRPSAYAEEAREIAAKAKLLNETDDDDAPAPEQLDELRQMLTAGNRALPEGVLGTVAKTLARNRADQDPPAPANRHVGKSVPRRPAHPYLSPEEVAAYDAADQDDEIKEADDSDAAETPKRRRGRKPKAEKSSQMFSLLGMPVHKAAWTAFLHDQLPLNGAPNLDVAERDNYRTAPGETMQFSDRMRQIIFYLGAIIPQVKDPSMHRLLVYVYENLPGAPDGEPKRIMRALAKQAVKAAGMSLDEQFARRNPACRVFERWVRRFDPDWALREAPMYSNNPYDYDETDVENAEADVISEFDPDEFLAEPDMAERIAFLRDEEADGYPMVLHRDEVMSALVHYITGCVELRVDLDTLRQPEVRDQTDTAKAVYPKVVEALRARGIAITMDESTALPRDPQMRDDLSDAADLHSPGLGLSMGVAPVDEDAELSYEDVLFPSANQGDDLEREVTAATVTDPVDGHVEMPDGSYVGRLATLAGLTTRPIFRD